MAIQNGKIWKKHYENLYSAITLDSTQNNLLNKLEILQSIIKENQNPLDYEISKGELLAKIQALQPRKASGPDGILNEILRFSSHKTKTATLAYCHIKIGTRETDFFPKSRGVKQGCSLSPAPFNIYIDQLAKSLEESEIPGLTLSDTEVKCLLFADDLILLAPSKEALQKQLDHLQKLHAPSSSQGSSVLQLNYYT